MEAGIIVARGNIETTGNIAVNWRVKRCQSEAHRDSYPTNITCRSSRFSPSNDSEEYLHIIKMDSKIKNPGKTEYLSKVAAHMAFRSTWIQITWENETFILYDDCFLLKVPSFRTFLLLRRSFLVRNVSFEYLFVRTKRNNLASDLCR